jgi:hypothetical protein
LCFITTKRRFLLRVYEEQKKEISSHPRRHGVVEEISEATIARSPTITLLSARDKWVPKLKLEKRWSTSEDIINESDAPATIF